MAASAAAGAATGLVAGCVGAGRAEAAEAESLLASTYKSHYSRDVTSDAVHAGEDSGCSSYPIHQGTTNRGAYSRDGNPTINSVEVKIKRLAGAEFGIATACGMAAISQTLLTFLGSGSRVVAHRTVYSGTQHLFADILPRFGVTVDRIDMTDPAQLGRALERKADMVYFEVHSNPNNDVIDVKGTCARAKRAGALVVVDNTWLTPYLIQPLALGADIVIHSATKYMMGHGNGLAGIVCGARSVVSRVGKTRTYVGGIMAPMNAFLLHQGLKTLPMRMERHCANAMKVAEFLESHPKVRRVRYPGLASDPGHAVARSQVRGFGGMLGFETKRRSDVKRHVKLCRPWTSLGDVETLIGTYGRNPDWGIPSNYYRMSIGIEDPDDIVADLTQALGKA
jgi:methionine-gamma-lyase